MSTNNQIDLVGFLATNPTLETDHSGRQHALCEIGVSRAGATSDTTGYFKVAVYGKAAEPVLAHLHKGHHVAVHGELRHHPSPRHDGADGAVVIVGRLLYLDRKNDRDEYIAAMLEASYPQRAEALRA